VDIRLATNDEIAKVSKLSVSLGNVPFDKDSSIVATLVHDDDIIGFAAARLCWTAAGSWVNENYRRQGHSYGLRKCLDDELRRRNVQLYIAIPNNDFERTLFSKYGLVTEHVAQVRHL